MAQYKVRSLTTKEDLARMSDEEHLAWKKRRLNEVREDHEALIKDLGIDFTQFNMKMAFYDKVGRNVVGIFASEFKKDGFYIELVDRYLNPLDDNRTVFKLPINPVFHEEYEMNEKGSYLLPIEELRIVNSTSVAISGSSAVSDTPVGPTFKPPLSTTMKAPATIEDAPYSEMTIRDFYAITSGKPVSTKNWLNDLIKKST